MMVVHTFNTSAREAEVGGSLWIRGQPGIQSKFKNYKENHCLKNKTKQNIVTPSRLLDTVGSYISKNVWVLQTELDGLKRKKRIQSWGSRKGGGRSKHIIGNSQRSN